MWCMWGMWGMSRSQGNVLVIVSWCLMFLFLDFLGTCAQKRLSRAETSELGSLVSIRISPVKPGALGVGFCHQRWCDRWCCLAQTGLSQFFLEPGEPMLFLSINRPNLFKVASAFVLASSCSCFAGRTVVRFSLETWGHRKLGNQ